jgi:hypothetical protein
MKIDGSTIIVWVLSSTVGLPLALIKVATITCTLTNSWQQHLTVTVEVGGGTLLSRPYQAAAFSFSSDATLSLTRCAHRQDFTSAGREQQRLRGNHILKENITYLFHLFLYYNFNQSGWVCRLTITMH